MTASSRAFAPEMLALLERVAARSSLPVVSGLHLPVPAPAPANGSHKVSGFCALELADGSIGLSYLLGDVLDVLGVSACRERFAGMPALELASWYADSDPVRRTVGFAAANAISQRFFRIAGYALEPASDSIGLLEPRPGDRIGMVGLFGPLLARIVAAGAELTVLELDPALAGQFQGYRVTLDPAELAGCTKIVSTTTILLNDTLDSILSACRSANLVAMIGPGGGCLPDPLFARGVTLLGGSMVIDRDGLVGAIERGESWGRFTRKYCIERSRYPGFGALI
jgi:uncharacterized protein (DUF4213/DUF364 family)